ncbi:MAG: cupredoxin domain-containing protein [Nitrospirota bacterium]
MRIYLPFLGAAVGLMALPCTAAAPSQKEARSQIQIQGSQEQRIEIVIEDRTFFLAKGGPIQIGTPIEIVLENRDKVRHGFTSSMLIGLLVSGEDDQIVTYGKGVEGFYVNPGKTLVIRFSTERPGSFPFHCDLHERMKGELYVLEVPTV